MVQRPSPEARLEGWSRRHAVAMLAGVALAAAVGRPWPVVALGAVTFSALIAESWRAFTPSGRFGWANGVTSLRLVATLAFPLFMPFMPRANGPLLASGLLILLALDGLDGWLARRQKDASPFGAHFDMETDALLVLLVDLDLWQRGALGPWILATGLLRYLYVLLIAVAPGPAAPMPRSRWARHAFVALMVGLGIELALGNGVGHVAAALGSVAVIASFMRSFYWSYRVVSRTTG